MQKNLDLAIKKHEIGTIDGGYSVNGGKPYVSYMSNEAWADFEKDMILNHNTAYVEFGAGAGGEMKQKGVTPPKMASYGSSSRMIYSLFKEEKRFHYEHKLPTVVGGVANLDGFMEKEDRVIFVEAKCREIYGAKPRLIEKAYHDLYRDINDRKSCNLNIQTEDVDGKMKVVFSVGDENICCFDIKQMSCHLLSVAAGVLREPTDKKIIFVYLCYNPNRIEIEDEEKREKILLTYEKMCRECALIDFQSLFETILLYLCRKRGISTVTEEGICKMVSNFEFFLCDQTNCKKIIN